MKKNFLTLTLASLVSLSVFAGCSNVGEEASGGDSETGSVYYLNFKPEVDAVWQELAETYTAETGVDVKVMTVAGGNYESNLKSVIAKKDAPTLFHINGPIGYNSWKDYTTDLSDTEFYNALTDKEIAIKGDDNGIYAIPLAIEGYGIIYNDAIMEKYFALDGAKATTTDEINSFEILEAVVEDMQVRKDELGIKGVFASTSFTPGEEWRWHTHLPSLAINQEYQEKGVSDLDEVEFTASENMKNLFDLYIDNSLIEPTMLGSKGVSDSMAEFALGEVAMVQNGNWAWGQISGVDGNTVKEEDVKFLPMYSGFEGEENQGLAIGTENFLAVNSQSSEADQKATIDFVNWLISSEVGKDYMINKLGYIAPFTTFTEDEKPTDPLAQAVLKSMEDGKTTIPWAFTTFPSRSFKDSLGSALLEYAQGTNDWAHVETTVVEQWKVEKEALK